MAAAVYLRAPEIRPEQVEIGRAIRATTWADMVLAANHLLGHGAELVPFASRDGTALTGSKKYRWQWKLPCRYQSLDRLWRINLRCDSAEGGVARVSAPAGTGEVDYAVRASLRDTATIRHREERSSQSDSDEVLQLQVECLDEDLVVDGIGCVEIPRLSLDVLNDDLGLNLQRARPGLPAWADSGAASDHGFYRLVQSLVDRGLIGRRIGLHCWAAPYEEDGVEVTGWAHSSASATPSNFFLMDPPVLTRAHNLTDAGSATSPVAIGVRALCKTTAGNTGVVTVSATSGDSQSVSFTDTTWTWKDITDLTVLGDDFTEATGLDGGSYANEELTWTLHRSAGAGTVWCAGLVAYEKT